MGGLTFLAPERFEFRWAFLPVAQSVFQHLHTDAETRIKRDQPPIENHGVLVRPKQ